MPNTGVYFFYDIHFLNTAICRLNNVRNTTLLEKGFFSLLHCGEDTAMCVNLLSVKVLKLKL